MTVKKLTEATQDKKEVDIWRDTPVRLLGYANEIGESFHSIYPRVYYPSYILASTYCLCDVADKAYKTHKKHVGNSEVVKQAVDATVWQFMASVFVPGFVINRTVKAATWTLARQSVIKSPAAVRWLPVCIGIFTIPFIVEPIDHTVGKAMDLTIRKFYN